MNESNVRLSSPEELIPIGSRIPIQRARRWLSPYESQGLKPRITVFVTQRAYVRFCAHAGTDLDNEVGGGLAGRWRVDSESGEEFIVVEGVIPARHTRHGSTFLTFTQDTLVALHEELENRFPGKELVGWFHTHPRMGVFLSGYDVWLHEHFFPQPWQVALVIEPHSASGGFFIRQEDGRLDPHRYFGFFELARDGRGRKVVHWNNLKLDKKPDEEERDKADLPARPEPASETTGAIKNDNANPPARPEGVNGRTRIIKDDNANSPVRPEGVSERTKIIKDDNANSPARSENQQVKERR